MYADKIIQLLETSEYSRVIVSFIDDYMGIIAIVALVIYVLYIIAMWKLFKKAGEEGWESVIPIYNDIVLFKISGVSPWLFLIQKLSYLIPYFGLIVVNIISIYKSYRLSKSFGKGIRIYNITCNSVCI